MHFTRRRRRWLSASLLATLLFMQWVTMAHACPVLASSSMPAPQAESGAMPGCDGGHASPVSAADSAAQCKAHCEQGRQAVNSAPAIDFDVPAPLLAIVEAPRVDRAASLVRRGESLVRSGAAPPGSPPLYLSLQVLRN